MSHSEYALTFKFGTVVCVRYAVPIDFCTNVKVVVKGTNEGWKSYNRIISIRRYDQAITSL